MAKKEHNGIEYLDDVDYSQGIKDAVAAGDYEHAADLERRRNAKIDGEGMDYDKTYKYQNYLDKDNKNNALTGKIGNIWGQIQSSKFEYDPEKDENYKIYKKLYEQSGKKAMQDTLGDAAALTGGRASTAAQIAAQETYNDYMSQLSANIPALRSAAYSEYRDGINDKFTELDYLIGQEEKQYQRGLDEKNWQQQQKEWDYMLEQDKKKSKSEAEALARSLAEASKNEAYTIAQITGDYSGLLEHGVPQKVVDALNEASRRGNAEEKAALLAQYGYFDGYRELGWSDEEIAGMENTWHQSVYGNTDNAKLDEGGYYATMSAIESGEISYATLKNDGYYVDFVGGEKNYNQLLNMARDIEIERYKTQIKGSNYGLSYVVSRQNEIKEELGSVAYDEILNYAITVEEERKKQENEY